MKLILRDMLDNYIAVVEKYIGYRSIASRILEKALCEDKHQAATKFLANLKELRDGMATDCDTESEEGGDLLSASSPASRTPHSVGPFASRKISESSAAAVEEYIDSNENNLQDSPINVGARQRHSMLYYALMKKATPQQATPLPYWQSLLPSPGTTSSLSRAPTRQYNTADYLHNDPQSLDYDMLRAAITDEISNVADIRLKHGHKTKNKNGEEIIPHAPGSYDALLQIMVDNIENLARQNERKNSNRRFFMNKADAEWRNFDKSHTDRLACFIVKYRCMLDFDSRIVSNAHLSMAQKNLFSLGSGYKSHDAKISHLVAKFDIIVTHAFDPRSIFTNMYLQTLVAYMDVIAELELLKPIVSAKLVAEVTADKLILETEVREKFADTNLLAKATQYIYERDTPFSLDSSTVTQEQYVHLTPKL